MVNMTMRGWMTMTLIAAVLSSPHSIAQSSRDASSREPPAGGTDERPTQLIRMGLDDPALKLTATQKFRIDNLVDSYLVEQRALVAKFPPSEDGRPPGQEMHKAIAEVRSRFAASVNRELDETQRKAWEAVQQAARPRRGVTQIGTESVKLPQPK